MNTKQEIKEEIIKLYALWYKQSAEYCNKAVAQPTNGDLKKNVCLKPNVERDPVLIADGKPSPNNEALYTNPPQRTWVGLTAKEKHEFRYSHMTTADFIDAIEAKLKDKNTSEQE